MKHIVLLFNNDLSAMVKKKDGGLPSKESSSVNLYKESSELAKSIVHKDVKLHLYESGSLIRMEPKDGITYVERYITFGIVDGAVLSDDYKWSYNYKCDRDLRTARKVICRCFKLALEKISQR